jgi:hypothetical protein
MFTFLLYVIVALILLGLFLYLARWAVSYFGLPQPIYVVVVVLVLVLAIWWLASVFPAGGLHPAAIPPRR